MKHKIRCGTHAVLTALLIFLSFAGGGAKAQEMPPFLKPYYAPLFSFDGKLLQLTGHSEQNSFNHYGYRSTDQTVSLSIDYYTCNSDLCRTVFNNALKYSNEQAKGGAGQFRIATDSEYRAEWKTNLGDSHIFAFRLPTSVQFWTYTTRLNSQSPIDATFDRLKALVNRQRYEDAVTAGNIEAGRWNTQLREYAHQLLMGQQKVAALSVLQNLIATAPFDFEAQMDFALNTPDDVAARNSAMAVFDNAESPELIEKAAQFLHVARTSIASLPLVDKSDSGLQVILIPLGDADVGLLRETAKVYETITHVPVKLRRLASPFPFGTPDRVLGQRAIQQAIVQKQGPTVDFTGWDAKRYGSELMRTVADADPLARFSMRVFVDKLEVQRGQYMVDAYLNRFGEELASRRSGDPKTIYVGVTDANIYSGDVNFLFSLAEAWKGAYVSILSYGMMTARTLGEPYESRKRLVERLAKELVPASLKALNIPRAVDPSDPYSYSAGVERLNEKSLTLSKATKDALDKFR